MRKITVYLSFILLLWMAACALNPVTGKRELSLISEKSEIALGQETDVSIRRQYGIYNDPALNEYVTRVGMALVPYTHRPHLTYHFAVLDTPVINAFAVPGGYIYVTRGVLAMMNSEAELAVVLGHELGHVNARHSVRKLSQLILVQFGLAVGSAVSEKFAEIAGYAGIGIQLLYLKFSRDDERQADQLGISYSRTGGYNPAEMIGFFTSLQSLGDLSGGHSLPGFLSTHPLTRERIENTQVLITESDRNLKVNKEPYLNRVNNLVYGIDPSQGYIERNTFYHPEMRFYFGFPNDWELQNSPAQVILASKDGNAAVVLQGENSSESLEAYAKKKVSQQKSWTFISDQKLRINGLSSYQQLFDITQEEKENLRARIIFIKHRSNILTFTALSTINDFDKYDPQFRNVIGSFKKLTDRTYLDRRSKRLKLVKASGKQTLQNIFRRAGMAKDLWVKFAIMNAMKLDGIPQRNQLIKVAK